MPNARLLLAAAALCCAVVPACEDNPDQMFQRAPNGAGDRWNDGRTPPTYDREAKNGFTDTYNSSSRQELCSGAEKHERWAKMVREPLRPPRFIAGIDLAGSEAWTGLDFRKAEQSLCQSKARTIDDPENLGAAWGDGNEVEVDYGIATNTITNWRLNPGYRGKLEFESRPEGLAENGFADPAKKNPFGAHKFSIGIGVQIQKDGRPHEINWLRNCSADRPDETTCWQRQLTEMYDALMYTYAKELPSTQNNCVAEQKCLGSKNTANQGLFGVRPLGTYIVVPNYLQQPAGSTPAYFYGFYVKLMPFSGADLYVKLDDEGPLAVAANIGDPEAPRTCRQHLGLKFGDFLANCVNISNDQNLNSFVLGKLMGGMSHTKEAFNFSVEAVKLDFRSNKIGDALTVGDDWMPAADDAAYEFEMDIRASGKVLNEWTPDAKFQSLAATGAIYREYARRVQTDIHAKLQDWLPVRAPKNASANGGPPADGAAPVCQDGWVPNAEGKCRYQGFEIGDPRCLLAEGQSIEGFTPAEGCTGFEQFITPAAHDHIANVYGAGADPGRVSIGWRAGAFGFKTALKAGDPIAMFCADPPPNGAGRDSGPDGAPVTCGADRDCFSNKCLPAADSAPNGPRVCESPTKRFFQHCEEASGGLYDKVLTASHKRVLDLLAHGVEQKLPPALRDRKFYFRHLAWAIVKYLKAAPHVSTDPQPLDLADAQYLPGGHACDANGVSEPWGCEPEPDHLLFDQMIENSDRDKFEYIDRRFATNGKEPMKVEYEILINSSNQQNWRYHRKLTRPERALYDTMKGDNVRLTNLVGSRVLADAYKGFNAQKDAHYCASTLLPEPPPGKTCLDAGYCLAPDPDCASIDMTPPADSKHGGRFMLDDYHQPLLKNYRGAFTGTVFGLGTSYMKMVEELPLIKSARVHLPIFDDPYAPGGAPGGSSLPTATAPQGPVLIADWRPKTPANGVRIPVNEQLDRFIPSATIVFGGSSLTLDLDYSEQPDKTMRLEAVQSDNYMGNVFICRDPLTKDLLSVEQYESMDVIQDWLNSHPGSREACGIITRPSAFGDYPLLFGARNAGVVLDVGLGSGVGRITHIEIYDTELQ